jgi:hypothetical protein
MEYKIEDILKECKLLINENKSSHIKRAREYLDKRNYLIGILYYKYGKSEKFIADHVKLERTTVHNAKANAYTLLSYEDISFMANACNYIQRFPFEFPRTASKTNRGYSVVLSLNDSLYKKIKYYQEIKGDSKISVTIKNLLEKNMKIWEE